MPDRDVFDNNVRPGWRKAARLLIGRDDDPDALPVVLGVLAKTIRTDGCPGFDNIVEIVSDALLADDRQASRRRAHQRLDRVRLGQRNSVTTIAAEAAKRLLAAPEVLESCGHENAENCKIVLTIATHILAELADAFLVPSTLLAEIVEQGQISFQSVHSRRTRMKALIAAASEARQLAAQLLADPSGASLKIPRTSREKPSLAEILVTALTD